MTLKDLARQAKEKAGDFTLDDFCQHVLDSIKSQQRFIQRATDIEAFDIYAGFIDRIGDESLSEEEKRLAFLNHVLEKYKDE